MIISVVTPSFNQGAFITETIESVLSQAGDFYIDYIIIDACSNDGSVEIIKKYEQQLISGSREIHCSGINYRWISETDGGQADGINKGLRMAEGGVFCWLNSDDTYPPGTLAYIAQANWDRTDLCYGNGVWIDRDGGVLGLYPTFAPNKYTLSYHCTLCQPAVFFSRELYLDLGELSCQYDLVFDYEYWLRAVFAGKKFSYSPLLSANSRVYPENKSLSMLITGERERKSLHDRYFPIGGLNSLLKLLWGVRVDRKTRSANENLMERVLKGASIH